MSDESVRGDHTVRGRLPYEVGLVFAVAVAFRLLIVARSPGGFTGYFGYDASVYYSAGDALTYGLLPYRDFVLLHPPLLMVALTPFTVLGRLTSDPTGFLVGNLAFTALGGLNAVLVTVIGRRLGLGRVAAALGGLAYAVWFSAVIAEFTDRLEPLGNVLSLLGLLALATHRTRPSRRLTVAAGVAFGAAASVKIWWLAPLVIVLAWQALAERKPRDAARMALGALFAIVMVDGSFFAFAPSQMLHMVVLAQLGRPRSPGSIASRIARIAGIGNLWHLHGTPDIAHLTRLEEVAVAAVFLLVLGAVCALAWRRAGARVWVVLAIGQLAVLVLSPSYSFYYPDFVVVPVALTVAAAAATLLGRRSPGRRLRRVGLTAACGAPIAVVALATAVGVAGTPSVSLPFASSRLAAAVRPYRCISSDDPIALIRLNVLSRDLGRDCRNWVDVTGRLYGVDAPRRVDGMLPRRPNNRVWQADLRRYLLSGEATILVRPQTGLSPATRRAVTSGGLLLHEGTHSVFLTRPPRLRR